MICLGEATPALFQCLAFVRAAACLSNPSAFSLLYSVMLAAKFFDDLYYNNAYYAKVCHFHCLVESVQLELGADFAGWRCPVPRAERAGA